MMDDHNAALNPTATAAPAGAAPVRVRFDPLTPGIYTLVTLGGAAALSWEVLWQLRSTLALGLSARGTAITLAATMGGMTAGALLMGGALAGRDVKRPERLYGLLELTIGVSGLLLLPAFALLEPIDTRVYALSPRLAPLLHLLGIAAILGPPALAMGATIPVFEEISRRRGLSLATLYGANTFGAACGVLLISFVLLPALGVWRTCLTIASFNLAIFIATRAIAPAGTDESPRKPRHAAACGGFDFAGKDACAPRDDARSARPASGIAPILAGVTAFGTGCATFALEVAWFRSLRAAFHSTTDSFAIILVSVLLPIAAAGRLAALLRRRRIGPGVPLALAGIATLLATPVIERMDLIAAYSTVQFGYWEILLRWQLLGLIFLGPPILLLGIALPWLLEEFRDPRACGRLYALNTAGAVCGSVAAAWLLLPRLGFAQSAWAIGCAVCLLSFLYAGKRTSLILAPAMALSLIIAVMTTSSVGRKRVQGSKRYQSHKIIAYDEGPDSTATVIEGPDGLRRLLIDGFEATSEHRIGGHYMLWMGHLPLLLHPDPRETLVICFGTGQTAHAARCERPARLDIVELSPAVLAMAGYFPANHDVLNDPAVNAIVMDGRAWIRRAQRSYDVVTLEPMPPYFAGVNALYSREFYECIAARLKPGGIVAQWLPVHLLPEFYCASTAATFQAVFKDSVVWIDPVGGGTGILLGRGAADGAPLGSAWPGLERAVPERTLSGEQLQLALALNPQQLAEYAKRGAVITDDNQLLAYGHLRRQLWTMSPAEMARRNIDVMAAIAGKEFFRVESAPDRSGAD